MHYVIEDQITKLYNVNKMLIIAVKLFTIPFWGILWKEAKVVNLRFKIT